MEWVLLIAALGLATVLPAMLYRPPALFVVRLSGGAARAVRGKVTAAFLAVVEEIASESRVQAGEVRGVQRKGRIALWFSRGLPGGFQQRLRNWWAFSGWSGSSTPRQWR